MLESATYISLIESSFGSESNRKSIEALDLSRKETAEFWQLLLSQEPGIMSRFSEYYNFFEDCFSQKRYTSDKAAYSYFCEHNGWKELSYRSLFERSSFLAEYWSQQGFSGQRALIVLPFGEDYIVHLMAALKLGLCFSFYDLESPVLFSKIIEDFAPDVILTSKEYSYAIEGDERLVLSPNFTAYMGTTCSGAFYKAEEVVCQVLDPFAACPDGGFPLTAQYLFLQVFRDGHFYLKLNSGSKVLASNSTNPLNQPVLILLTLLSGACYTDFDYKLWAREKRNITELDQDVILIDNALREAFIDHDYSLKNCKLSILNLREGYELNSWMEFFELQRKNKCSFAAWFYSAGTGGALIYSKQLRSLMPSSFKPVPGIPITHESPFLEGAEANGSLSALVHSDESLGALSLPRLILNKQGSEYYYANVYPSHYRNVAYPVNEINAWFEERCLGYKHALIELENSWLGHTAFILLIFEDLDSSEEALDEQSLMYKYRQAFGEMYPIHRVECYPFEASGSDGVLDISDVKSDYILGVLSKKRESEFYKKLHLLKKKLLKN